MKQKVIPKIGSGDFLDWHTLSASQVMNELVTDSATGLASDQVKIRFQKYGANELNATATPSWLALFLHQFKNSLIIILLFATALSAVMDHAVEAVAIGVIVLFSVTLGFIQELRAGHALEALSKLAAPTALVLRDGVEIKIPARQLVPGDILVISVGDRFPADARLVKTFNLKVEEAILTGESLPTEKHDGFIGKAKDAIGDRFNMVFAGTSAIYGRGLCVVTATGMQTEFGRIAGMLSQVKKEKTPLEKNLDSLVKTLTKVAFVVVGLITILGVFRGQPVLEMVIFGIALAVAVVPEALPAVVTISLAIGVQRMIRRHALVRHLPAVETLGCTSIICSDKTGTLTRDQMTVRKIFLDGKVIDVTGSGYDPVGGFSSKGKNYPLSSSLKFLLEAGALSCDARLVKNGGTWSINGDPTEGAIIVAAQKAGIKKEFLDTQFLRLAEIPFTSESKRMSTLCKTQNGGVVYSKGAAEVILESCDRYIIEETVKPINPKVRESLQAATQDFANQALRVIGVSFTNSNDIMAAGQKMIFIGFFGMIDPPRPEAKAAIELCKKAGIKVMMITGDHPITAKAIALELGILSPEGKVITGDDLLAMQDKELEGIIEQVSVCARVSPQHKLRIVTALQSHGHIVAMTGDGINDAPAIKKADIGIAMGIAGTDVSREASAMILVDDNFSSIVAAVQEGRIIFDNIKKYLMYLLSSNIGEIGLMVMASLFGLPLPLLAVQILYINLATDGLPALALAIDPASSDIMGRHPRKMGQGIFTRPVVTLMLIGGMWSALVNVGVFFWCLKSGKSLQESMALVFVLLILIEFFKAYNFRSDKVSVLRRPFANGWLNLAIAWEFLILLFIIYVPFLQVPFKTHALGFSQWALVIIAAGTIIPVLEITKWFLRKKQV